MDSELERNATQILADPVHGPAQAPNEAMEDRRNRRWAAFFSSLAVIAFLAAVFLEAVERQSSYSLTVPLAPAAPVAKDQPTQPSALLPPPPDLPVGSADMTPEQARASNMSVPLDKGPLLSAPIFAYRGTDDDVLRAQLCMASAVLYEAGDNSEGEHAVAQIVLNRLHHPAFPKTICGVVFQGSDRPTGCQFTFTCDHSLARHLDQGAWNRAMSIAKVALLTGFASSRVGTATHYHTDLVVPYWRESLTKIAQIQTLIFYRWPGGWGTPAAFIQSAAQPERIDPKLLDALPAELSASAKQLTDDTGNNPDVPPADPLAPQTARPSLSIPGVAQADLHGATVRLVEPGDERFGILLDAQAYPGSYAVLAYSICHSRPSCEVIGWVDDGHIPAALPPPSQIIAAEPDFLYLKGAYRTKTSAEDSQVFWNCVSIHRNVASQCLPGTTK